MDDIFQLSDHVLILHPVNCEGLHRPTVSDHTPDTPEESEPADQDKRLGLLFTPHQVLSIEYSTLYLDLQPTTDLIIR